MDEEHEIVIVGAGICGLATALALHRKCIKSVVLERSNELRSSGAALGVQANGWRALHQLGVASTLRQDSFPIEGVRDIWMDTGVNKQSQMGTGESRCLRRSNLINALAAPLPPGTIRLGCHIISVKRDPLSTYHVLQLKDGTSILAMVLIGCDGVNSVISKFLNLPPMKDFGLMAVRGLTPYPNGHSFPYEFVKIRKNKTLLAKMPIDDKTMHWLVIQDSPEIDPMTFTDEKAIKNLTLESIKDFPTDIMEMFEESDLETISLYRVRYRSPWTILFSKFRQGTVTVAGDAMHAMGPFIGQGGSAALEDAIVIARCFSRKLNEDGLDQNSIGKKLMAKRIEETMDDYLSERKMRVVQLSVQTYLMGIFYAPSTPKLVRYACITLLLLFFYNHYSHANYDCGVL